MKYRGNTFRLCVAIGATIVALVGPAFGQTPEEHAQHHPAPGGASPAPSGPADPAGMPMPSGGTPAQTSASNTGGSQPGAAPGGTTPAAPPGAMGGNPPAGAGGAGMGAVMGEMMKQMSTPPRKEIYPSLMAIPDGVTPEQRAGIEQLAQERMTTGAALLSSGLAKLSDSTSDQDYAAIQQATAQMRDGLAQFESGVAARRLFSEGTATRNLALDWFKREMNLASPIRPEGPPALLGVTPLHLFTMVLLIAFALAMVAMYFFKMRRAAALFGRLGPDGNAPPPGSSPPLAGAPGPPALAAPPPGAAPAPASSPAAGPAAASATSPGGSPEVPVPSGDAANAGG